MDISILKTYVDNLGIKDTDLIKQVIENCIKVVTGYADENFVTYFVRFMFAVNDNVVRVRDYSCNGLVLGCREVTDCIIGGFRADTDPTKVYCKGDNNVQYNILSSLSTDIQLSSWDCDADLQKLEEIIECTKGKAGTYNQAVLEDIVYNRVGYIDGLYQTAFDEVKDVFEKTYAGTFSLYPYEAVLSFLGSYLVKKEYLSLAAILRFNQGVECSEFKSLLSMDSVYYKNLADTVGKVSSISDKVSFAGFGAYKSRGYNYEDIVSCSDYLYYPMEVYSYAMGYIPEGERPDLMYKESGVDSYVAYWSQYLSSYVSSVISKFIYKSLESHIKVEFNSPEFMEGGMPFGYASYIEPIGDKKVRNGVVNDLQKLVKSMCCAYVVTRNDDNEFFKLKVVDVDGRFNKNMTKDLFSDSIFTKDRGNITYTEAVVETAGKCIIYEYSFCVDVTLMDKKPLFGYTAARLFQRQNKQINMDNILIGEDESGRPVFATKGGRVDFSSRIAHRLSAGSRSGKGVMTMNILASAVASGSVLFYVDRKPDMASTLQVISGGRMFVVDGGQILSNEDTFHSFDQKNVYEGNALNKYVQSDKVQYKYPYMTKGFGEDFGDLYDGAFGDFVYMKAMILVLGIITARMYYAKNESIIPEGRDELRIGQRVVVVLDEVTNWHHYFEDKWFATDGNSGRIGESIVFRFYDSLIGASDDLSGSENLEEISGMLDRDRQAEFDRLSEEYKSLREGDSAENEKQLDAIKKKLKSVIAEIKKERAKTNKMDKDELACKLYWTTFFDKYRSWFPYLGSLQGAGIDDSMTLDNDVFMIGQFISGVANKDVPIKRTKEGTAYKSSITKVPSIDNDDTTLSYMFGFMESTYGGCDWFIGRNITNKKDPHSDPVAQFGADAMPKNVKDWLHVRGNWGYIANGVQEDYRGGKAENYPDNLYLLKPYLVLNTSDEPVSQNGGTVYTDELDREHSGDKYRYVYGVANRVGFDMWEKLRLQHVVGGGSAQNPNYGNLEPGIGLQGLITEYRRTNPQYRGSDFDPSLLASSGEMADIICKRVGGYDSFMDYLLDMSPTGIIGAEDIIRAYDSNYAGKSEEEMLRIRFPRYYVSGNEAMLHMRAGDKAGGLDTDIELENRLESLVNSMEAQSRVNDNTSSPVNRIEEFDSMDSISDGESVIEPSDSVSESMSDDEVHKLAVILVKGAVVQVEKELGQSFRDSDLLDLLVSNCCKYIRQLGY